MLQLLFVYWPHNYHKSPTNFFLISYLYKIVTPQAKYLVELVEETVPGYQWSAVLYVLICAFCSQVFSSELDFFPPTLWFSWKKLFKISEISFFRYSWKNRKYSSVLNYCAEKWAYAKCSAVGQGIFKKSKY